MKPFLAFLSFLLLAGTVAAAAAVYQCPMHPWIKSDKPGDKCTICGMDLVAAATEAAGAAADPNLVTLSPSQAAVVGIRTSPVRHGALERTLRVTGVIDDDDTRHRILAARVPGRLEKLYVNYLGAEVREGEPLATVFSPEMLTAQRTYVERVRAGTTAFTLSERSAAREKLLDLGLTEEEIGILEHTLQPTAMVNVRAPMSGTVVKRGAYEGQYVTPADRLFEIADFSTMWFVFDAYEPDLAWLCPGQEVQVGVDTQPGRVLVAPVAFIDPNFNETTRTARVRVVLPNEDRALRHKQTARGLVLVSSPDVLLVPRSAVLQHGDAPFVFVAQGDRGYTAQAVRLGRIGDLDAEVLGGLRDGDHVVTEGGLILDGQAQLAHAAVGGGGHHHSLQAVVPPPAAAPAHDAAARHALAALAFASADAAAALAADDLPGYGATLPGVRKALADYLEIRDRSADGELADFGRKLADGPDLSAARRAFELFSTAVADLARTQQITNSEKLWIYQCPMTPVLGNGRWLSRTQQVRNPYFGSAMLECGEEIK